MADAEIFTLEDARNTRIQWKKSGILIPPISQPLHRLQDDPQLLVNKSGHAPQRLNLNL